MSTHDIQITARRLQQIGRLVAKASAKPSRKKPWGQLPAKVRRAMQMTKAQREATEAKFAAAFVHVIYHIQPVGDGFQVWNAQNHKVEGTFQTFRKASEYVRENS